MSILSLCSGCGGPEQAIDQVLGHQTIDAYCDNYKPARQVLKAHNPWKRIHNDVNDEALFNYKSSIIAFGFPRQDLSNTGKRAGINGTPTSVPHGTILIDNTGDAWQSDHQLGWRRPGVDASWALLRKHLAPYTIAYVPKP